MLFDNIKFYDRLSIHVMLTGTTTPTTTMHITNSWCAHHPGILILLACVLKQMSEHLLCILKSLCHFGIYHLFRGHLAWRNVAVKSNVECLLKWVLVSQTLFVYIGNWTLFGGRFTSTEQDLCPIWKTNLHQLVAQSEKYGMFRS